MLFNACILTKFILICQLYLPTLTPLLVYILGIDLGTSSIKASIVDAQTGQSVASAVAPQEEMAIRSPHPGWAEQNPSTWWQETIKSISLLDPNARKRVAAIGISYQMHGLVMVNKKGDPIRPSIIWCDSRAAETGETATKGLGEAFCFRRFLNQPGNFTAAKLKWVQENEPENYAQLYKILLPGDYLAYQLTGELTTTTLGLSEGILWDFHNRFPAYALMDYWHFDPSFLPEIVPTFGDQGVIRAEVAEVLGLPYDIPVTYRAGDQPNNAFSLGVLHPGQVAATAGTSGVVYGISEHDAYDPKGRVNTFIHVNNEHKQVRNGVLLCVNGTGRLNAWIRQHLTNNLSYAEINTMAASVPVGSNGLVCLPFGNGAERIFQNRTMGACFFGLDLNRHTMATLFRAAQEGIVFALQYGMETLREMGLSVQNIRAGNANLFLSPLFRHAFVQTTGSVLAVLDTDGAQGAARAAGIGLGVYASPDEAAMAGLRIVHENHPDPQEASTYAHAYEQWKIALDQQLTQLNT